MKKGTFESQNNLAEDVADLVRGLHSLDYSELLITSPKLLKKAAKSKNCIFIQAEDVEANGPVVAARKIADNDLQSIRKNCAKLLRSNSNFMWSGTSFYWNLSDRGRMLFVVLVELPVEKMGEVGILISALEGLVRGAITLAEAKAQSFIDDVTELYNQRYLNWVLDKEIRRSERAEAPFSVVFIDIDHFKNVNDSAGHIVGSKLLKQVSDILRQNIRVLDYGFRYGGDEFILILVGTAKDAAMTVGERIRRQIETTTFLVDQKKVQLTLSIGVAAFPEHAKTKEEILRLADEAMYESKNKSRNLVSVAS